MTGNKVDNDTLVTNWIEDNEQELARVFLDANIDQWCCEEQGVELIESIQFLDFCEEEYVKCAPKPYKGV